FALDPQSGKALWSHDFKDTRIIYWPPAIDDGTIYLAAFVPGPGTHDPYIYALDVRRGAVKWTSVKLQGYLHGPIAFNSKVYVDSYDGIWYTLNAANGNIEAQTTLKKGFSGPTLINGVLYH